jgi:hypothetical protein
MSFDLASQRSFRTAGWIDKSASARAHAAHLQDGIFLDRDIMGNVGRLGVKAAGRQDFQVGRTLSATPAAADTNPRLCFALTNLPIHAMRKISKQPKSQIRGASHFPDNETNLFAFLKCRCWIPFARLIFFDPAPAMLRALPRRDQEDGAATERVAQKQGSHFPISLVFDRLGHRRRMRSEEQSPRPKRNGFRATLVLGRLDDLRDVGQEAKAVEKRKHGERGVRDRHAKAAA